MNIKYVATACLIYGLISGGIAFASEAPSEEGFNSTPSSSAARATSSSAGTTVNNQNNTQVNNDQYYGFGPGITCPTTSLGFTAYGGAGSGSGSDATVSSRSFGGAVTLSIPLGGRNSGTCTDLGERQLQMLQAQIERANAESAQTRTDIWLVTIRQCIEILQTASLSGQFADICSGVHVGGVPGQMPSTRPISVTDTGAGAPVAMPVYKPVAAISGLDTPASYVSDSSEPIARPAAPAAEAQAVPQRTVNRSGLPTISNSLPQFLQR